MPKAVKYLSIAVVALIGLALAAVGIIAATFNPNDYKPLIVKLVQEKKQRTLAIPGDIKLTFFPKIGADLGKVSLSEHKGSAEFVSIDSARVSLELIPLLSKQLVVDRVKIDGLHANIRRFKDGSTNFDDLLSKEEGSGQQVKFNIDSVSISRARISFDDQQARRKVEIGALDLETGRIANGADSKLTLNADVKSNNPAIDAKVAIKAGFRFDLDRKHYTLSGADAEIKGSLAGYSDLVLKAGGDADLKPEDKRFVLKGVKLSVLGKRGAQAIDARIEAPDLAITDAKVSGGNLGGQILLTEGRRVVAANFGAPSFEGSPQAFRVPSLTVDATVKEDKLDAKIGIAGSFNGDIDKLLFNSPQIKLSLSGRQGDTALDGSLSTPLTVNLKTSVIDAPGINAAFVLPNPAGGVLKLAASGRAGINLDKQTVTSAFKGKLDDSSFDARLGMSKFSPAAYTFDIDIDRLDLDRYKAKPDGAVQKTSAAAEPAKSATPHKPFDLSALRELRANGSVRVAALKVENIKGSSVRADIKAAGGRLDINPLSAALYGGNTSGSMSAVASAPPHFALRQNLTGVNVGPLLKDAIGKEQLEGRGNVQLDVTADGATFAEMKKKLNGSARLELHDGAVRGINVAQTVRSAKAKIGAIKGGETPQSGTGSTAEKTDFSELSGSFRINNGVAHNDDLSVKSPLIRVGGTGDVDLANERLDYLAKATVVNNLQGQGGPELQALKGLTVPVRLSGPFSAIGWKVDFEGLVGDMARQKIDEKKEEVRSKAQEAIDKEKSKVQDQIKDRLKGLLGK
jgi:AsmA protein